MLDAEERALRRAAARAAARARGARGARRQDLFAAWRLFFERLADVYPTVLAFEDMQWADATPARLRRVPARVVAQLARSSWSRSRGRSSPSGGPTWGAGQRSFTSLYLEPLPESAMEELLAGLVPGLPEELRDQILARAEGVPLYAVETVRMLLDRGAARAGRGGLPAGGTIGELEVPETLHALIAARLDGLSRRGAAAAPGRRGARQDVHARRRSRRSRGLAEDELEPLLASLVRKEVLGRPGGPALARARPVRLPPGPRAPRRLRDAVEARAPGPPPRGRGASRAAFRDEDEIVEVVASHYLDAYEASPRPTTPPRSREGARGARSRRRPRRVARRRRGGAALLRAGGRAGRRAVASGRGCSTAPAWRGYHAADLDAGCWLLAEASRSTRPRATRTPPLGSRAGSRRSSAGRDASTRRSSGWSARTRCSRTTSRTRTSRMLAAGSARAYCVQRGPRSGGRAGRARARDRRGARLARADRRSVQQPVDRRSRPAVAQESVASSSRRSRSRSSTTSRPRHDLLQPLRPRVPPRPVRGRARLPARRASQLARRRGSRPDEWAIARRDDLRARTCSGAGTRRWRPPRRSPRGQPPGDDDAEPAQSVLEITSTGASSRRPAGSSRCTQRGLDRRAGASCVSSPPEAAVLAGRRPPRGGARGRPRASSSAPSLGSRPGVKQRAWTRSRQRSRSDDGKVEELLAHRRGRAAGGCGLRTSRLRRCGFGPGSPATGRLERPRPSASASVSAVLARRHAARAGRAARPAASRRSRCSPRRVRRSSGSARRRGSSGGGAGAVGGAAYELPTLRRREPAPRQGSAPSAAPASPASCPTATPRPGGEVLRRVRRAARRGAAGAAGACRATPPRPPSGGSSRCCSPTWSASRPRPRGATPRTRASSSRATSRPASG